MKEVELAVGTGRVVLGPPLLVPVAGSGRFHGHDALRLIFDDPRALGLLRTSWRQMGLDGDPVQQSASDLRNRLEQAIASARLSAMYIPLGDDSRLDLEWYHTKDASGRRIVPQLGGVRDVDWDPKWTTFDKILKAIDLTIPRLRQAGRDAAANALESLIQPEAVALMVGLFAAWMAAHAYGLGEIADIAVIVLAYQAAGMAGLRAIADIASATRAAGNARSKIDLDRVADRYAAGLVLLGEAFLLALLARIMQKSAGKARAAEGGSGTGSSRPLAEPEVQPSARPAPVTQKGKPLDWSIVKKSTGETRLEHIMKHGSDNLNKELHGVFNGDPIRAVESAWQKVRTNDIQPILRNGAEEYLVDVPRAGWQGGSLGNGQVLDKIKIVVEKGTSRIITAYPE